MKSFRDWVFSQLLTSSLTSSRPLSGISTFFNEEQPDERPDSPDDRANGVVSRASGDTSSSIRASRENQHQPSPHQPSVDKFDLCHSSSGARKSDPLTKMDELQIKFLRLLQRLGPLQDNLPVAKVLYRIHLATLIQAGDGDSKIVKLREDKARAIALAQEAAGSPDLDFSFKILVLGRTGVGKSATINSIFDQEKTVTSAFQPATDGVKEITGIVNGVKITFIDTPGLFPSSTSNLRRNRKTLFAVKKYIRKSPPDMVLFFERLDLINMSYSEFPLFKLVTEVFGSAIWLNTILVITHACCSPPEGPNGYPVMYDSYVSQCSDLIQHYIHQAISDSKLENPVLLVENHHQCKKNLVGEKVLPNGQAWRSQLLLLCICTKVLNDISNLVNFRDGIVLGPTSGTRQPSLPHLLSSLLQHHSVHAGNELDDIIEEILLSRTEEEDEYDQLPPIRILTKSQFQRLSNSQKKDYLDELDYRETLYMKKQIKEELRKRRDSKLVKEENMTSESSSESEQASPEPFPLPDMSVPPSFDADCPVHRYRGLVTSDQLLVRPVLDPHGWDHDVGFDGINLETAVEAQKNIVASVTGQISKDKSDFSIHSQCVAAYKALSGGTSCSVGLDVQSASKDLIYTLRSSTRLRNLKHNVTEFGASVTSFENKYYTGAKVEDTLYIGERLKFVGNVGRLAGAAQVSYGGSIEATLRGRDYPVRSDNINLTMTVLSFEKEMVLSGSLQSEFHLSRSTQFSVSGNLNNRKMGQISIKASSSEHMEIALIALVSIFRGLFRRKTPEISSREYLESG